MNKKRLTINLVANLFSYVISILVSFLLTPYLVSHLGKEIYGFYGLANSVVNYITVISVALNSMAAKYITVELVRGNDIKAKHYFSSIFFSNVIFSIILTPILTFIVLNLKSLFAVSDDYLKDIQILFGLVFAGMVLRFITCVYGSATYATNRIDLRAYADLGKTGLRAILFTGLFTLFQPSIIYVGAVIFILELYNAIIHIGYAKKIAPMLIIKKSYYDIKLVWATIKIGIWNSLNHLGDLLLSSSDLIVGNIMLGESASGVLSIIKTMPSLISGIITAINTVFMPRIATRYGQGEKEALIKEVNLAQRIMGIFTTTIVMLIILFGREFFSLWVPGNDSELLMILSTLDVSRMMIIGVTWPVSNLNIVMDKIRKPSLLVIVSGLVNVVSMYVLIKYTWMDIYAIPLTTLILSGLFYGVFIPLYAARLLNLKWYTYMKPVFEMIICAILVTCIISPIKTQLEIDSWFHFLFYGGLCGILIAFICLMIYIKPQMIVKVIKFMHHRYLSQTK